MTAGRPTIITNDIKQFILDKLSEGYTLREIFRLENKPAGFPASRQTIYRLKQTDKEFLDQYAIADECGSDECFEELIELSNEIPPTTDSGSTDGGFVNWKRLQIDVRKWRLSKKFPKKYGDSLDLNHSGNVTLSLAEQIKQAFDGKK